MTTLLLLPGVLNNATLWQWVEQSPYWPRESVQVVHAPIHQHDQMTDIAQSILRYANLGDKFAVAGFSMGGYVALELMRQAAERISHLGLINSKAVADSEIEQRHRHIAIQSALKADADHFVGVTPRLYRRLVAQQAQDNPRIAQQVYAMAADIGRDGFLRQQQANINRRGEEQTLQSTHQPVLLCSGEEDKIVPPLTTFAVLPASSCQKVLLPKVGHLSPLEAPDDVAQAIVRWLNS